MHELEFFHLPSTDDIAPAYTDWEYLVNYTVGSYNTSEVNNTVSSGEEHVINNWWALVALLLVVCTVAGNVLVCLAIYLERRLQNVTNYFLMSLAITDLLVAILVMPLGILTLVKGKNYKNKF